MTGEGSGASGKPLVTAGYRDGHWERAFELHRPTKTYLKSLRTFGYTRVKLTGSDKPVTIKELLEQ